MCQNLREGRLPRYLYGSRYAPFGSNLSQKVMRFPVIDVSAVNAPEGPRDDGWREPTLRDAARYQPPSLDRWTIVPTQFVGGWDAVRDVPWID